MAVAFHWSMVAYYAYADITYLKGMVHMNSQGKDPDDHSISRMFNGSLTYITLWNVMVQQVYFMMCCRENLLSRVSDGEKKEWSRRARQVILRSILFPTTFVVAIIYWTVYWRSPTLIFGDKLSELYPAWVDHTMHTFIVPIALLELYLSTTRERVSAEDGGKLKGWLTFNAFITTYSAVVIFGRLIRGVWPYPFLDPVNNGNPILFFIFLYVVGGFWYYVGQHLTHKIWRNQYDGRKRKHQL
ncbi:androgen-dependent TFPI-regulating protein-like [Hetaerina americana]|uniref:androgen-dependent TFPI-regulating protein-like n=1 Tax=Hetaerina americana TaxID=62018 RepID=UPI003A7F4DC6